MFIEVGHELWHWFCHMIGVERNTHFKDKLLSHWYTSNETQLQRWTFNLKSGGTQKSEKKQGTRQHLRAPFKAMDMGCLSNFGQPKSHGRHPPFGFVQKCGNYSTPLRCGSVDLSFPSGLHFGPIFQLYMAFSMQLVGWSAWIIVPINSQPGQSQIPCNKKQCVFEAFLSWRVCISMLQEE